MAPVLKTGIPERVSGVRISSSPPVLYLLHLQYVTPWSPYSLAETIVLPSTVDSGTDSAYLCGSGVRGVPRLYVQSRWGELGVWPLTTLSDRRNRSFFVRAFRSWGESSTRPL